MKIVNASRLCTEDLYGFLWENCTYRASSEAKFVFTEVKVSGWVTWQAYMSSGTIIIADVPKLEEVVPDPVARAALGQDGAVVLGPEELNYLYYRIPYPARAVDSGKARETHKVRYLVRPPDKRSVLLARVEVDSARVGARQETKDSLAARLLQATAALNGAIARLERSTEKLRAFDEKERRKVEKEKGGRRS